MMTVFHVVLPVFLIMGVGWLLIRVKLISREVQQGLNAIAYWVGLPCLLFIKVARADLSASDLGGVFTMTFGGMAGAYLVSRFLAGVMKLPAGSQGAFVQAAFRGNLAFVALPVVEFSLEAVVQLAADPVAARARADAAWVSVLFALGVMVIWYNFLGVTVLALDQKDGRVPSMFSLFRKWITNPLIIACVLGWLVNVSGVSIPIFLERSCESLGRAALAMALLGIGAHLALTRVAGNLRWAVVASGVKCVISPLCGWWLGRMIGIDDYAFMCGLLMLAAPTAVASYVLTDQMGGDSDLGANCVVVSTACSFGSFIVLLMLVT